ncbi:MAG TPA: lysophospholipid acyltransferase family protein [Opitutaceae bacterium]|nr:lysophospholipid acyltransferase family protein [Opitutaceae bacterium]
MNSSPPSPSTGDQTVYGITGWKRVLLSPLGLLVRAWGASLRIQISETSLRNVTKRDEPVAFVLWHNRLFIVSEVFRRFRGNRPISALISASRDGAWLAAFFDVIGIHSVRGSSSRFGREAVTALVDEIRAGKDIGITPDGPRGPCYELKPGALIVSRRTQTPILLLSAIYESAWQLSSWDRFYLPAPFSQVRLLCWLVQPEELAERDRSAQELQARLMSMTYDAPDARAVVI